MYCSKSINERTRECMRKRRLNRRENESSQARQDDQNEQCSMDISKIIDQATIDILDDSTNVLADYVDYVSCRSESSSEFELNVGDDTNDDFDNETDDDDDDDNINEYIHLHDHNNQTKLFSSCPLSIREACLAIIKLARRLNLDKSGIKILLNDIRRLFPSDLKLPRSVQGLMKIIGFDYSKKVIYYCCECLSRLTNPEQKTCVDGCSLNNVRRPFRNVIEVAINNIKDEVYATAKRHINLINEYSQCSNVFLPYDVLNGSIYECLKENQKQLTLALHTDGAPVTKMGGKSLWPVQATILEFPPPIRDHVSAVMVFGAWLGGSHPNRELLWNSIVDQIKYLYKNGIILKLNDNTKIKFNIRVQFITFDLPALAHNCNITQFNGYDACPFCKAHGYAIGTQLFYAHSPTPSIKKTDGDYLRLSTTDLPKLGSHGIKGPTPLTNIMLFPYQIAVDYMHLMHVSPVTPRPQRTTAGQTYKYTDFSVLSFPQLKKHSIIKTSLINIDPLSPIGAQSGNIKAYGERKKLVVLKTGTRQQMEEVSTRFSKESGSEEIAIPERQCDSPLDNGSCYQKMNERMDEDYDECTPTVHHAKNIAQEILNIEQMLTNRPKTSAVPNLSTSGFDDDDNDDDRDFNRIFSSSTPSAASKIAKRKKEEVNRSRFSASSDSEEEDTVSHSTLIVTVFHSLDVGSRWSKGKENLIRTNVDVGNLKNKKPKKKKQRTDPIVVQNSNADYKSLTDEIDLLKKRLSKLEKVYGVIRRNTSFDQTKIASMSTSQVDITQDTIRKVKDIFGVDPATLKAPISRPTKVMRELYKNSGYELFKWKEYFEAHELVLKDFIQQKCLILSEEVPHIWSTIINSMAQMPYDAVKYKTKNNDTIQSTTVTTANDDLLATLNVIHHQETVD
ncbi:unnamed protein product [Rotaria magnacalcarata]|nr:unnamed protein product [Rotaria magnacalcarata]